MPVKSSVLLDVSCLATSEKDLKPGPTDKKGLQQPEAGNLDGDGFSTMSPTGQMWRTMVKSILRGGGERATQDKKPGYGILPKS